MPFTRLLAVTVVAVVFLPALCGRATAEDAAASFQAQVQPVLASRCTECHGTDQKKAKLDFSVVRGAKQLASEEELWFRVLDQVESGRMPPPDEKQPSAAQLKALVGWIRGDYASAALDRQRKEGRSRLRRLNRREYANTVFDLTGLRPTVGSDLPEDGRVDGYDKVSSALSLSSGAADGYFRMSEQVLAWVLRPAQSPARTVRVQAEESGQSPGHTLVLADQTKVSFNSDTTSGRFEFGAALPGMHHVRFSLYGYQTGKPMTFGVYAGHVWAYPQILDQLAVLEAPPGQAAVVEADVYLRTRDLNDRAAVSDGLRVIPFGIGVQVPKNSFAKDCTGPGLAVQWMEVEEPAQPLAIDRWITADLPKGLAAELRRSRDNPVSLAQAKDTNRTEYLTALQTTFMRLGQRFYRREVTAAENKEMMTDVVRQIDAGAPLATVFLQKVTELMTAPDFLCVVEPAGRLSDAALASRLSYLLWNSTPDEALLELARKGRLHEPKVLHEQTERLLADPKSARFVSDFVNQWLGLRALDDTTPDHNLYPDYDDVLKLASGQETEAFFRRMLDGNLSVRNLVAADWAMVNERLARHYGLPAVEGAQLRKVPVPEGSPSSGLWTQAAVMKVTANGTNTSPVKRGRWVAERLLGIPIPPPPPNIKPVEPDVRGAKTLREQFALHSNDKACAACHAKFDPYGFALESFDVTGAFRTRYREVVPEVVALQSHERQGRATWRDGLAVDCSGRTPEGKAFSGIAELRQQLKARPEALARGVLRNLVTYATGTPASGVDQLAIENMVKSAAADDYGLRSLIHALVQSELFGWK